MVRLVALFALTCSLVVAEAEAASVANYTPTVVAGVFKGVGIQLKVYSVSGGKAPSGAYTWLRPDTRCEDTSDPACVAKLTRAQFLLIVVCPTARAAAWVASGTPNTFQTTTIRNVVVAYEAPTPQQRPRNVVSAISRLRSTQPSA